MTRLWSSESDFGLEIFGWKLLVDTPLHFFLISGIELLLKRRRGDKHENLTIGSEYLRHGDCLDTQLFDLGRVGAFFIQSCIKIFVGHSYLLL